MLHIAGRIAGAAGRFGLGCGMLVGISQPMGRTMNEKQDKPKKVKTKPASVVFHSYPKLIFIWPIIAMGLVFYFIGGSGPSRDVPPTPAEVDAAVQEWVDAQEAAPDSATIEKQAEEIRADLTKSFHGHSTRLEVLGWVYIVMIVLVVLTIGVDIERNIAVFWLAVIVAFFFLGRWLADAKGFTLFGDIYEFFDELQVQYDNGLGLAVSLLLLIPYSVIVFWARIQNKWRITHNEFEHYSFGRADDSLARGAKRVRSTYPDLLELLLLGSGTLIVYSATGRSELRRIPNVPLLPLMRRRINAILEQTAVTVSNEAALVDEASDAEAEERGGAEEPGGAAEEGGREPL